MLNSFVLPDCCIFLGGSFAVESKENQVHRLVLLAPVAIEKTESGPVHRGFANGDVAPFLSCQF